MHILWLLWAPDLTRECKNSIAQVISATAAAEPEKVVAQAVQNIEVGGTAEQEQHDSTTNGPGDNLADSAPKTVEPLHGDWLVVKRKKGKNPLSNQLRNGNGQKGKTTIIGNDGKREKRHALGVTLNSNAFNSRDPLSGGHTSRDQPQRQDSNSKSTHVPAIEVEDEPSIMQNANEETPAPTDLQVRVSDPCDSLENNISPSDTVVADSPLPIVDSGVEALVGVQVQQAPVHVNDLNFQKSSAAATQGVTAVSPTIIVSDKNLGTPKFNLNSMNPNVAHDMKSLAKWLGDEVEVEDDIESDSHSVQQLMDKNFVALDSDFKVARSHSSRRYNTRKNRKRNSKYR